MALNHRKISNKIDSSDHSIIQPSDWNDNHTVDAAGVVFGPSVGAGLNCAAAGQNYHRYLRRKLNYSTQEEYEFVDPVELNSSDYNFSAQSPNAALTANIGNLITLTPVPLGIWNDNIDHYLYINDTIAGSEIIKISGGTATSGATSGTILVTPTKNHAAGQYTIRSASSGIQEALQIFWKSGIGGVVRIPTGSWNVYATITYRGAICQILGCNGSEIKVQSTLSNAVFIFDASGGTASHNEIGNLRITGYQPAAYQSTVNVYGIIVKHQYNLYIHDIVFNWCFHGIRVETNDCFRILIQTITLDYLGSDGFGIHIIGGTDVFIMDTWAKGTADPGGGNVPLAGNSMGIRIDNSGAVWIHNFDAFLIKYGMFVCPGNGQEVAWVWVSDTAFDNCVAFGLQLIPAGTGVVKGMSIDNSWSASCALSGICIGGADGIIQGINIISTRVLNNKQRGIMITGANTKYVNITNNVIAGNNQENGGAGDYSGVEIFNDASFINISNNQIVGYHQDIVDPAHPNTILQGSGIVVQSGVMDNLIIKNNLIRGYKTAPILNLSSSAKQDFDGNTDVEGLNTSVASAASITLTKDGRELYTITGTVKITTIINGIYGQILMLMFTASTPAGIGSGGNIYVPGGTFNVAQNETVILYYGRDDLWRIIK